MWLCNESLAISSSSGEMLFLASNLMSAGSIGLWPQCTLFPLCILGRNQRRRFSSQYIWKWKGHLVSFPSWPWTGFVVFFFIAFGAALLFVLLAFFLLCARLFSSQWYVPLQHFTSIQPLPFSIFLYLQLTVNPAARQAALISRTISFSRNSSVLMLKILANQ